SLAFTGAMALFLGLMFGNFLYVLTGLFLLSVVFLSRRGPDLKVLVDRKVDAQRTRAREPVNVQWRIRWRGGPGVALVADKLPDPFQVEEGASLRVVNATGTSGEETLAYQVSSLRRGGYALAPTNVAVLDPLGIAAPFERAQGDGHDLTIEPPTNPPAKLRAPVGWGTRIFPAGDKAKAGARGSDFRELRGYVAGDPLKYVNWRATARKSMGDDLQLTVNEFEPEGKQAFWIFLDVAPHTEAGTTTKKLLDDLVDGALTVADGLLKAGYRVGFSTFGGEKDLFLHPDGGIKQYRSLVSLIGPIEPEPRGAAKPHRFAEGVVKVRAFLVREKPTLLVFTRLGADPEGLTAGLMAARAAAASRGRVPANAFVFAPHALPDSDPAAPVVSVVEGVHARRLERTGIRVVRWGAAAPLTARLRKGGGLF
ncbi:MAG TPA: DUF58 domain-containing protein, partial [Candidatus Thermoplasmatota archaeon]|nr:DUF58 domain-containing protein [Candidatus Thermoplasmatota archaeon]